LKIPEIGVIAVMASSVQGIWTHFMVVVANLPVGKHVDITDRKEYS
jgi:hypothetical protein